jgi:drug/metabolite transporter (DMT)-like permease
MQDNKPTWLFTVVLAASVLIVSSAAIMIRIAQAEGVSSLSIAAWRLAIAAIVLTPVVFLRASPRQELAKLTRGQLWLAVLSGVFLAAHFASWISSLTYTSVASSTALVTTNPIWIAIASWLLFREKLGLWLALGIAAAITGSTFIFISDMGGTVTRAGANPLLGNALAVVGSLTVCGYLLIGRKLRAGVSLLAYIWLVYTCAALTLMVIAYASGQALAGFSLTAVLCLLGLGLGPQLLGHSGINWALKHVSASFIAVAILGEPIGSALLAWWIFGESFAPLQLAGFVMLLVGIFLASRNEAKG